MGKTKVKYAVKIIYVFFGISAPEDQTVECTVFSVKNKLA